MMLLATARSEMGIFMGLIDLHVHSNVSDGTLSPDDLVNYASQRGVSVMALTDHDTTLGIDRALTQAAVLQSRGVDIRIIPGIEISAAYADHDIHILGYYINHLDSGLNNILKDAMSERDRRNAKMVELFRASGIPVTLEELKSYGENTTVTRAHFAHFLIEKGYCKTSNEAFDRYLGYNCPYYVNRRYLSRETAVKAIRDAGGIAVLAHPLLYKLKSGELNELIAELKDYGLQGIETYYSANISNDEDTLRHLALKHNLVMTGGSDFHGNNKPQIEIGTGRGNLRVPKAVVTELEKLLVK